MLSASVAAPRASAHAGVSVMDLSRLGTMRGGEHPAVKADEFAQGLEDPAVSTMASSCARLLKPACEDALPLRPRYVLKPLL